MVQQSPFQFLVGSRRLSEERVALLQTIAGRFGATFTHVRLPEGWRYWFAASNDDAETTRELVLDELRKLTLVGEDGSLQGRRRAVRTTHAEADERRIDQLQEVATEALGRGAAVSVDKAGGGHRVIVFSRTGDEVLTIDRPVKSAALDKAIRDCRRMIRTRERES